MVFVLSVRTAVAADPPTGGVEVGVNINKPSFSGPEAAFINTKVKAGLLIGAFAQVPISNVVAIQPEFLYSQKRFGVSGSDGGGSFSANVAADVVEVPILFRLSARHAAGALGFYAVVGPGFGFRARAMETNRSGSGNTGPDRNIKNQIQGVDYSIIGGAGISKGKWDIEGRYDAGLRNLNRNNQLGNLEVKSRTTSILFRLRFK